LSLFENFFEVSLSLPDLNLKFFDGLDKLLILPLFLASPDVPLSPALNVSEYALEAGHLHGELRLIEGLSMGLWRCRLMSYQWLVVRKGPRMWGIGVDTGVPHLGPHISDLELGGSVSKALISGTSIGGSEFILKSGLMW